MHNAKTENDQEFVIVIRVTKSAKRAILPEEFNDLMKLDKEAKRPEGAGVLGEYELNDKSGRVQVKLLRAPKVKAMRAPKLSPKRLKGSGSTTKPDPSAATPEEAARVPPTTPRVTEATPLAAPPAAQLAKWKRIEQRTDALRKSISIRPKLMQFPGARGLHLAKTEKGQEYAIVIRVKKAANEAEMPQDFGDIMTLDKEAKTDATVLGEYELNDKSCRVQVKLVEVKVKAMRAPRYSLKRLKGSGSTTKADPDAAPAEAAKVPPATPRVTEATRLVAPPPAPGNAADDDDAGAPPSKQQQQARKDETAGGG